ncbi:putative O-glycosylation ligase, exosortase A system-associated [Candidatus Colwellia aromaticivorans]|uniref:putative O-glycosylation ligase, exosortase A system-associated n=1 Tax=Candidatus Colwellia aromaticivorans TaxID=2267621 RepID=UPI000DF16429|nr:putative O-glycosylation ligase, exosortase A system-associated [Candidatus Colwellia aromaticivorans]
MRDLILFIVIFGSIPFILKRPFIGVLMWCWISYMVPHRLAWGFITHFPVAQLIGLSLLVGYLFSKEPKSFKASPPLTWLIIFIAWMLITFLANSMHSGNVSSLIKVMKILVLTFVILMMLTSKKRIELTLWVVALSIGFYGLKGGVFTILTGGSSHVWGPPGGFFGGNNELGLALLMDIPLLVYLMRSTDNKWLKYLCLAVIGGSAVAVLGTQSRGAAVAGIACCAFLWLKSDKKMLLAGLLILAIPLALSVMPDKWFDRMSTIVVSNEEEYDGSVQGRFNAWRMASNLAAHNVFGGGFNVTTGANFYLYAPNPRDVHAAHSIYFQILGQHGYIGLIIFLSMWFSAWRLASKTIKLVRHKSDLAWAGMLSKMLQVSLIAYATGATFLSLAYFDLPYHILITVVAVNNIVKKKLAEETAPMTKINVVSV